MADKPKYGPNSRAFMYSPDCLEGRIFVGADAIAAAEKDGWVDHPDKAKAKATSNKVSTSKSTGGKGSATNDNS